MVPPRMARNVPISTSALPPTSSSSVSCCGSIEYLTGPNSADWVPMQNSTTSSSGRLPSSIPRAPASMMRISANLIRRISTAFSKRSPNCPPSAEKRKNGRMNSRAQRLISRLLSAFVPSLNRIARIRACLNTLSLNAPSSWVQKNGRNRRLPSRRNCERGAWALPTGAVRAAVLDDSPLISATARAPSAARRSSTDRRQWSPAGCD